jgi:hypothetical protein
VASDVYFPNWRGEARWLLDGELLESSFDEDVDEETSSQRLRVALQPSGGSMLFMAKVLEHAVDELERVRRTLMPDAAGLVICEDARRHAVAVADLLDSILLERRAGHPCIRVFSGEPWPKDAIRGFMKSKSRWMVAVRMVSEGVDIPRLKVGVYATTWTTELFFRQFVGRFVRTRPSEKPCPGAIIVPRDPRLTRHIARIDAEVLAGFRAGSKAHPEDGDRVDGGGGGRKRNLVGISSDGEYAGDLHAQEEFDAKVSREARRIHEAIGGDVDMTLLKRILMIHHEPEAEDIDRPTWSDRRMELRREIQSIVGRIAPRAELEHEEVHNRLNSEAGIESQEHASIEQLLAKREAAGRWLAGLVNGSHEEAR